MSVALVTGGTGCLGTPLVRRLADQGGARVLTRSAASAAHLSDAPGVSVLEGSLEDREALRRACDGVEVVYHLAAKVHSVPRNRAEADEFHRVNADATAGLMDAARAAGVRRVVLFSTVAVYGDACPSPANEKTPPAPATPYGRSKLAAEEIVLGDASVEGVALRLPVAYGPLDRGNIGKLIRSVAKRRFFWVNGGRNRRSLIGAENAADAALLAGRHESAPGEVFLVSDGPAASLAELIHAITAALGEPWTPPNLPAPVARALAGAGSIASAALGRSLPFERETYSKLFGALIFDTRKIQTCLGFRSHQTLHESIAAEVSWMRANGIL